MTNQEYQFRRITGILGILGVMLFLFALLLFGNLNPTFHFLNDFVSKLGAKGEPLALWWNLIGFAAVGIILIGFGIGYGIAIKDRLAGVLLALFGLGFTFTAIPMDMQEPDAPVSTAHILAICLSLAFWLFGLARISYHPQLEKSTRSRANITAVLIVVAMLGSSIELWSMPLTHRLVFLTVFGWTGITALEIDTLEQ